jgi:hypothetical protein
MQPDLDRSAMWHENDEASSWHPQTALRGYRHARSSVILEPGKSVKICLGGCNQQKESRPFLEFLNR